MHFEWATVQDGPAHGHGHWLALYMSLGTACWSINVEWEGIVLQFAAHQLCMLENEKFCGFIYTSSSRKRLMGYFRL